jgi:hypothetical protein
MDAQKDTGRQEMEGGARETHRDTGRQKETQECTRRHKVIQGDAREVQEGTGRHNVLEGDVRETQGDTR